jgi:hypothetical protein
MNKILRKLGIIQERKEIDSFKKTIIEQRLNPYNPLTYIFIPTVIIIGILLYGVIEVFQEERVTKPFKWH